MLLIKIQSRQLHVTVHVSALVFECFL